MFVLDDIILVGSVLTLFGTLLTLLSKVHKWFLRQDTQDVQIKHIKEEHRVLCQGISACLDGLEQLGCNHSVPKAIHSLYFFLYYSLHE